MAGFFCSSYFSLFFLKVTVYFFFFCFENINNEYQSLVTALQTTCIKPASLEGNVRTGLFNPRKFLQRVSHFSTCSAYIAIKKKKRTTKPNQKPYSMGYIYFSIHEALLCFWKLRKKIKKRTFFFAYKALCSRMIYIHLKTM